MRRNRRIIKDGMESPESTKCPLCHSSAKFSYKGRDLLFDKARIYDYYKCTHCGACFQEPKPTVDQISRFYPKDYSVYQELEKIRRPSPAKVAVLKAEYGYSHLVAPRPYQFITPLLAVFMYRDSIPYRPGGTALDVGCGNGKFIRSMNALGWDFQGVELNKGAVDVCRKAGLRVFHGELREAGFPDGSFDLITARHLIEHVPDPNNLFTEMARLLKPEGWLLIKTPNSLALGRSWFRANWYANDVPRHLILYSPDNLLMLAKKNGLRPIRVKTFTSPKIILNSWDYLIGNRSKPSKRKKIFKLLARPYVVMASLTGRGDEIFAMFKKG